jgi:hypothetical protein
MEDFRAQTAVLFDLLILIYGKTKRAPEVIDSGMPGDVSLQSTLPWFELRSELRHV